MKTTKQLEQSKGDKFTQSIPTNIWKEECSITNPYIAEEAYCYGYNFEEIVDNLSYVDALYLMLTGRVPTPVKSQILELSMKIFLTPGPRHPATRAAMNAGIGRTNVTHVLPISLSVLSSDYLGSKEVGNAMRFIAENRSTDPKTIVNNKQFEVNEKKPNPIPGFGSIYGGVDQLVLKFANKLASINSDLANINWCKELVKELQDYKLSWLPTGLAAAVFLDLELDHRTGVCLFQMLQSPGLIAHGVEKANKPLTDMPFIKDENYAIKR
jgi:citrate synthase